MDRHSWENPVPLNAVRPTVQELIEFAEWLMMFALTLEDCYHHGRSVCLHCGFANTDYGLAVSGGRCVFCMKVLSDARN